MGGPSKKAGSLQTGRITESELVAQSREFLHLMREGLARGGTDASNPAYEPAKQMLGEISRSRALQGFSPSETATFIFSLKHHSSVRSTVTQASRRLRLRN